MDQHPSTPRGLLVIFNLTLTTIRVAQSRIRGSGDAPDVGSDVAVFTNRRNRKSFELDELQALDCNDAPEAHDRQPNRKI
jgi:hypothetical protein